MDAYCLHHPPQLEHRSQSDSNRQPVSEIIALVYAIRRIKPEGEKRYLAVDVSLNVSGEMELDSQYFYLE